MSGAANRFALSALSRSNKASAVNEEILMDKETGQVLVKTPNGDIISYDSIARMKNHIDLVTKIAQDNGLKGDLHVLEFENMELPSKISEDTNLLSSSLTLKTNNLKRFLISVDVDTIELSQSDVIGQYEPIITLDLEFSTGGNNTPATITGKTSEILNKVINPAEYVAGVTDFSNYTANLKSIKVVRNSSYSGDASLRHILHSVLVIIE
jgi:hypothetical protein